MPPALMPPPLPNFLMQAGTAHLRVHIRNLRHALSAAASPLSCSRCVGVFSPAKPNRAAKCLSLHSTRDQRVMVPLCQPRFPPLLLEHKRSSCCSHHFAGALLARLAGGSSGALTPRGSVTSRVRLQVLHAAQNKLCPC